MEQNRESQVKEKPASDAGSKAKPTTAHVNRITGVKKALMWTLSIVLRLYFLTLRFHCDEESKAVIGSTPSPCVIACWHNRIILSSEIKRRYRNHSRLYAMISASKDGALITSLMEFMGLKACRGSSSKRSVQVMRELSTVLQEGADVALTPDGPRGPIYSFHDGAAALAMIGKANVALITPNIRHAHRFDSWDGLYLPYPFARIDVVAKSIPFDQLPKDRKECASFLKEELLKQTEDLPHPPRAQKALYKEKQKKAATS